MDELDVELVSGLSPQERASLVLALDRIGRDPP
jgi:hypothetical protein